MADVVSECEVRPYRPGDAADVLEIVNRDRLPGQPMVDLPMLETALAGGNNIDSEWWAELSDLVTEVAVAAQGTIVGVVGVIAHAHRARDNAGVITWLHAGENAAVIGVLLDSALARRSGSSVVEAFSFASALTLGLEALPVRHRPRTHAALTGRGFVSEDLWRYMYCRLPAADLGSTDYTLTADGDTRTLRIHDGEAVIGEATIGLPVQGVGELRWIRLEPAARGRGLGAKLLGSALALLAALGSQEAILYVDDDEPGGERDRSAANHLYELAGFAEIDRLHSYRRPA